MGEAKDLATRGILVQAFGMLRTLAEYIGDDDVAAAAKTMLDSLDDRACECETYGLAMCQRCQDDIAVRLEKQRTDWLAASQAALVPHESMRPRGPDEQ